MYVYVYVCVCVLQTPLLIKVEDNSFSANLHSSITTVLEESKWMTRLQYKMPEGFYNLQRANIKDTLSRLVVSNT